MRLLGRIQLRDELHRKTILRMTKALKYLLNCFLLITPVLILNLLWASRLPPMWQVEFFWKDISPAIAYGENISRLLVNVLPVFMPLRLSTKRQRTGLVVYIIGTLIYFMAWVLLVYFPQSTWSTSLIGSTAAAWTSLLWLIGIGLIGDSLMDIYPAVCDLRGLSHLACGDGVSEGTLERPHHSLERTQPWRDNLMIIESLRRPTPGRQAAHAEILTRDGGSWHRRT
ncbi:MAG TPA: hypothetical protein VJK02_15410 [Anaerolineales bacterium]|nr:hypothetical protein [Anaerolineales bacterium]